MKASRIALSAVALLAVAQIGCRRTPGYIGTFAFVQTPAFRAFEAHMRERHLQRPGHSEATWQQSWAKFVPATIVVCPDGTGTFSVVNGESDPFTYTVSENALTISSKSRSGDVFETSYDFDPAKQTLTERGAPPPGGFTATFQKQ